MQINIFKIVQCIQNGSFLDPKFFTNTPFTIIMIIHKENVPMQWLYDHHIMTKIGSSGVLCVRDGAIIALASSQSK
jgi:hypothetical protein